MRIGTAETLSFVRRWLPRTDARILEVGCGDGELAAALGNVVALDADPDAVAAALARGVDARLATWPSFVTDERFDAVLFTRSLHHITPLDEAVVRAHDLLRDGGRVIVEDFSVFEVSDRFVEWLRAQVEWEPHHDIHPFRLVRSALASRFTMVHEEDAPYAYRYVDDEPTARRLFAEEQTLGERMLGRRLVGERQ